MKDNTKLMPPPILQTAKIPNLKSKIVIVVLINEISVFLQEFLIDFIRIIGLIKVTISKQFI